MSPLLPKILLQKAKSTTKVTLTSQQLVKGKNEENWKNWNEAFHGTHIQQAFVVKVSKNTYLLFFYR